MHYSATGLSLVSLTCPRLWLVRITGACPRLVPGWRGWERGWWPGLIRPREDARTREAELRSELASHNGCWCPVNMNQASCFIRIWLSFLETHPGWVGGNVLRDEQSWSSVSILPSLPGAGHKTGMTTHHQPGVSRYMRQCWWSEWGWSSVSGLISVTPLLSIVTSTGHY